MEKRNRLRRLIASLMTAAMILTLMPVQAFSDPVFAGSMVEFVYDETKGSIAPDEGYPEITTTSANRHVAFPGLNTTESLREQYSFKVTPSENYTVKTVTSDAPEPTDLSRDSSTGVYTLANITDNREVNIEFQRKRNRFVFKNYSSISDLVTVTSSKGSLSNNWLSFDAGERVDFTITKKNTADYTVNIKSVSVNVTNAQDVETGEHINITSTGSMDPDVLSFTTEGEVNVNANVYIDAEAVSTGRRIIKIPTTNDAATRPLSYKTSESGITYTLATDSVSGNPVSYYEHCLDVEAYTDKLLYLHPDAVQTEDAEGKLISGREAVFDAVTSTSHDKRIVPYNDAVFTAAEVSALDYITLDYVNYKFAPVKINNRLASNITDDTAVVSFCGTSAYGSYTNISETDYRFKHYGEKSSYMKVAPGSGYQVDKVELIHDDDETTVLEPVSTSGVAKVYSVPQTCYETLDVIKVSASRTVSFTPTMLGAESFTYTKTDVHGTSDVLTWTKGNAPITADVAIYDAASRNNTGITIKSVTASPRHTVSDCIITKHDTVDIEVPMNELMHSYGEDVSFSIGCPALPGAEITVSVNKVDPSPNTAELDFEYVTLSDNRIYTIDSDVYFTITPAKKKEVSKVALTIGSSETVYMMPDQHTGKYLIPQRDVRTATDAGKTIHLDIEVKDSDDILSFRPVDPERIVVKEYTPIKRDTSGTVSADEVEGSAVTRVNVKHGGTYYFTVYSTDESYDIDAVMVNGESLSVSQDSYTYGGVQKTSNQLKEMLK